MSFNHSVILPALAAAGILATGCAHHHASSSHHAAAVQEPPKVVLNNYYNEGGNETDHWTWNPSPPSPAMSWVDAGPYRKAQRKKGDIVAIVIHTTEGNYRDNLTFKENQRVAYKGNVNYFKGNDREVSAHFVMGPKGEICQMVNETDIAHTQTYYNGRGIGIECAGWGRFEEQWTPEMMDSLVNLCAYLCVKWDIPAYHPDGTAYEGPYSLEIQAPPLDDEGKPKRSDRTNRFLGRGLVGHYQVQPWNKTDPGPHFPWKEFSERVRERIRDYGLDPIALPPLEDVAKEILSVARIKEDAIKADQPFTYELTIFGNGANEITPDQIVFPDFAKIKGLTAGAPTKSPESTANRAIFEVPLTSSEAGDFSLHAARINFKDKWSDSPTVSAKVE
ncbi:N-acetylmuramoyl-L-alanine amidase [Candidatus Sumerlaeota bacterium]|nr:N-acetylmuramoyl-L-alanine amidase [Candidatus Sumerlaeota bacterium]